jgi:prolyl-tRNA editing enzyme YbaK/EbsC (Cys-tRNA(Pro) deacylase)
MNNSTPIDYPPNVHAVLTFLRENQIPYELATFEAPARQASQAAALVGCPLGAIVKSLVFEKTASGELLLVMVSGQNRADEHILNALVGEPVQPAKPEAVLAKTGYPVGAVPPCGLCGISLTIIDADLMGYPTVWASAGAVDILMRLRPSDLSNLTDGRIEEIKQRKIL